MPLLSRIGPDYVLVSSEVDTENTKTSKRQKHLLKNYWQGFFGGCSLKYTPVLKELHGRFSVSAPEIFTYLESFWKAQIIWSYHILKRGTHNLYTIGV